MFSIRRKYKREIWWWEPRWAYAPRFWRVFRRALRPRRMILATGIALLVFAGIVTVCKWFFPLLQLGFLWMAPLSVVAVDGYMLIMLGIHLAIPPVIAVKPKYISRSHGQAVWYIAANNVNEVRIVVFAEDRVRLRVFYTHKSRRRATTLGVSPMVDLDKLSELLPVPARVRDARRRVIRVRSVT